MLKWMIVASLIFSVSLKAETKVLALHGSTRENSLNQKLVLEAADIARELGDDVTVINLKDFAMPFYDSDLENQYGLPPKAKELRCLMMQSQVILIASPEYNGSLSGVLKNAIDWATRSETGGPSREAFKGKKFVIMSATPGGGGTEGLSQLRKIIERIGGTVLSGQVLVNQANEAFDESGHLKDPRYKEQLRLLIKSASN